jgi:HSP20 family protein
MFRWSPWNELNRLSVDFDRLLDGGQPAPRRLNPAIDVTEDDDKIVLFADLPGLSDADVDLQIENDVLTLKGARKEGRFAGTFERSFTLPNTIDREKVAAAMKNGVLTLTLPKRAEAQKRQIKVNIAS